MEVECAADSKEKEGEAKQVRRRRKKIYQAIRQQMEFYFSDANLTKDRFLSKITLQDPYVDLRVFLSFNKIRALTNSVDELANALSNSELLSLSEDRTKVARLTPVRRNVSEDECSIYVEGLPPDAKHDWLQEVFSLYGKVVYVSIPKYRQSGKIKGFAFVEFESAEIADKALEAFHGAGCCLPTDMAPEQLCSVTTFEPGEGKWQVGMVDAPTPGGVEEGENGCGREVGEEAAGSGETGGTESIRVQQHSSTENISPSAKEKRKKRRRRSDGNEEDAENDEDEVKLENLESEKSSSPQTKKKKKKNKKEEEEEEEVLAEDGVVEEEIESTEAAESQKKRKRKKDEEVEDEEGETEMKRSRSEGEQLEAEGGGDEEGGVKRKRKKRNRNKREKLEGEPLGLRILSKRDWKRLRNKYLQLQRKNMQMLRSQMMGKRWCNYWGGESEGNSVEQQYHGGDMELGEDHEDAPKTVEEKGKPRVKFVPGVIVKILFKEPLEAARKFKEEVKNLPKSDSVAYIDVKDAASAAYIRCHSAEAAKELIKDIPWEDRSVLEGSEEKEYWDKIMKDRAEKIDKKIRVNQRGRDKILRKAENLMGKHLRYDN
ncbi:la-related protein 7 isoform X2 [Ischnura elegans]|uniref:la-related protein 7 isoform X2 n=1 Tax=Ischnura elegans TaxID=197161 RepID=UPI001ED88E76|nr:la-related protein 7 isoform X2 [Ischnura elegans]